MSPVDHARLYFQIFFLESCAALTMENFFPTSKPKQQLAWPFFFLKMNRRQEKAD